MTPIEIAYFKHFIFDKDLQRTFVHFFKTSEISGKPESIEEYFLKISKEDVIMKAFLFRPNNYNSQRLNKTYDYWKAVDDQWQDYINMNSSNFTNDNWPELRGSFAILRQNWDIPYYWKRVNFESTEEVYKRMGIDLPLPPFCWPHGEDIKKGVVETEEETTESVAPKENPVLPVEFEEDDDDLEIDFVEPVNRRLAKTLAAGVLNVNTRNQSWRVTINRTEAKEILDKSVKFAMIGRLKNNGDVVIRFCNNTKGYPTATNKDGYVNINSKEFVTHMMYFFNVPMNDITYLNMEKISEKDDSLTYKITK